MLLSQICYRVFIVYIISHLASWSPGGSRKGPIKQGLSILLSGHILGIVALAFSKFWQGFKNPYGILCDRAGFSRKNFCPQNLENQSNMDQNQGFS